MLTRQTVAVAAVVLGCLGSTVSATQAAWFERPPDDRYVIGDQGSGPLVSPAARPLGEFGGSVAVSDGRVWWVGVNPDAPETRSRLYTRRLSDGRRTSVPLRDDLLVPPTATATYGRRFVDAFSTGRALHEDKLVLTGGWATPRLSTEDTDPTESADEGFEAVFDGRTGALLQQRRTSRAATLGGDPQILLTGTPAILRLNPSTPGVDPRQPSSEIPLTDAVDGRPLAGHGEQAAGRWLAGYTAGSHTDWERGRGELQVQDAATGEVAYRLAMREIAAASGGGSTVRVRVWLQADASLRVIVRRHGNAGLRPVSVAPDGIPRGVGPRRQGVREAVTITARGRTFVSVLGTTVRATSRRRCSGVWIVSPSGRRGRELTTRGRLEGRQGAPTYWDGTSALWTTSVEEDGYRPPAVRVENGLRSISLSRTDRPRC